MSNIFNREKSWKGVIDWSVRFVCSPNMLFAIAPYREAILSIGGCSSKKLLRFQPTPLQAEVTASDLLRSFPTGLLLSSYQAIPGS